MSSINNIILVLTNLPDVSSAEKLAGRIIESRLAACITQFPLCTSTYRWKGTIKSAAEIPLLIKTTLTCYPRLEKLISAEHPYELPEIIAVPVTAGYLPYLDWVSNETFTPKD